VTGIYLNGELIDGFNSGIYYYSHQSEFGTLEVPTVTATAEFPDATFEIIQPTLFGDTAYVTCYAGDGTASRTYRVLLTLDSGNNAKLAMIKLDEDNILFFAPSTFEYTKNLVRGTVSAPDVTAIAQDERAEISIDQNHEIPSTAVITVTARDGITKETYYVHFQFEANINARLASIMVDGDPIENFRDTIMNYTIALPENYFGTPIVTAIPQDPNATIAVDHFSQVHNKAIITVTAENPQVVRTYEVTFYKGTGISESIMDNFKYYPNPVSDILNIETSVHQSKLQIVDNYGRVILTEIVSEIAKIDVSRLLPGMYVILLDGVSGGKFVKL